MRRARPTSFAVLALVASACGGKVVLDAAGVTSSSSSSSGMGGAGSTVFSASVGSVGGLAGTDFAASTVGSGFTTSTGGAGGACGSFQISGEAVCQTCAASSCCAELAACDVGTPCSGYMGCIGMCGDDDACLSGCETQFSSGLAAGEALSGCYLANCGAQGCALGASTICDTGATTGDPSCDLCLGQMCCPQISACLKDTTCDGCLSGSGSSAQCSSDMLLQALDACAPSCSMACGGLI